MQMWININDQEIKQILDLVPEGSLAKKLREPIDPDYGAFVTDDELEVDPDAVISRGDDGAFVMGWIWVSNEQAGLPSLYDDDDEILDSDTNNSI